MCICLAAQRAEYYLCAGFQRDSVGSTANRRGREWSGCCGKGQEQSCRKDQRSGPLCPGTSSVSRLDLRAEGWVGLQDMWGESLGAGVSPQRQTRFAEKAQLPGDWPVHETTRLGKQQVCQAWTLVQEPGGWRRGLEVGILMGRVPAGGMEIRRPGEPLGRQVQTEQTDGTSLLAEEWGGGGTTGSGGQSDTKKPRLGRRVQQVENSICKMDAPQGFLARSDKESGTERPLALQAAHPTEGSWELAVTQLKDLSWRPASPGGEASLGRFLSWFLGGESLWSGHQGNGRRVQHILGFQKAAPRKVSAPSGEVWGAKGWAQGDGGAFQRRRALEEGTRLSQERCKVRCKGPEIKAARIIFLEGLFSLA